MAKHGYCPTNIPRPRHWGFCSRSCEYFPVPPYPNNNEDEVDKIYEEGIFRYYENNPHPTSILNTEYLSWWKPDHMKAVHKCMGSIIPRAKNVVFKETNIQGDLLYDHEKFDAPRHDGEYGQIGIGPGDSGSPITYEENGVTYLIAINSNGNFFYNLPAGYHTNNPLRRCDGIATKVTEDIIGWALNYYRIHKNQ